MRRKEWMERILVSAHGLALIRLFGWTGLLYISASKQRKGKGCIIYFVVGFGSLYLKLDTHLGVVNGFKSNVKYLKVLGLFVVMMMVVVMWGLL
jgi:hypothetical protein